MPVKTILVGLTSTLRAEKKSMSPKITGFILIIFSAFLFSACNENNNAENAAKTDSTTQTKVQRDDDRNGGNKVYQGMEMIKSGNDMVNKGEKANDRPMINNGMALMDKGMEMVKSGRSTMNNPQHENEGMDDKMAKGDSTKRTQGKDMDMGDYGMNMIHQGIEVAKSGKILTEHAQKNKDKPMMQTGMDMMDKGMAMITSGKEMMGKDSSAMAVKPMADDMNMMDKGMNMMGKGKVMADKALAPADKPMMDDNKMDKGMDMMDKGMNMMDKGMNMMDKGADKMKKDKKPMSKKNSTMKDDM